MVDEPVGTGKHVICPVKTKRVRGKRDWGEWRKNVRGKRKSKRERG